MKLKKIKGFPDYLFDAETGDIISQKQRNTRLKIRHGTNRKAPAVQMIQGDRRRWIYYNRLLYAMQHGIGYDDIPKNFFIISDMNGGLRVITKSQQSEKAIKFWKDYRSKKRTQYLDRKMKEMEIIRRCYTSGTHAEALDYIEQKKKYLVRSFAKKHGRSLSSSELLYNLALEKMLQRIDSPVNLVTELTTSMLYHMNKERKRLAIERPLFLKSETASSSNSRKNN